MATQQIIYVTHTDEPVSVECVVPNPDGTGVPRVSTPLLRGMFRVLPVLETEEATVSRAGRPPTNRDAESLRVRQARVRLAGLKRRREN